MNVKKLHLTAVRSHSLSVQRSRKGKLFVVWKPKLPPGYATVVIEQEGRFDVAVSVHFHKPMELGHIHAYPGLRLLSHYGLPMSLLHRIKLPRSTQV